MHAPGVTWDDISPEEEQTITEGLTAIYGEERDDLGKVDKAGSRVTRYLIRGVIALAVVAVCAYLAYFIYARFFAQPSGDPLTVTIDAAADAVSGAPYTMTVRYANAGTVPLAALSLDCNIPDAFVVTTVTPAPTDAEELIWDVGALARGGEGTIVFEGMWFSDVPATRTVQVLSTYRPANFNADFDDVATAAIATASSTLSLAITGPEEASPGEEVTYDIALENTGEAPFSAVSVDVTLPSGFSLDTSTPTLEPAAPPTWALGDIAPHTVQHVVVVGSYASDVVDVQNVVASVTTVREDDELTQAEATIFTDVSGNGLVVQLVGNGASGDVTMDPGDPLRLTVGYRNTSEAAMSDVSVLVDFQADGTVPITWKEASLDGGRLTADGIRFDGLSLAVGEDKMKNLVFPVRAELESGDVQEWKVVVHATLDGVTLKSQPLTVRLNADVAFSAAARYYDASGAPRGEGVLPPRVGETTAYELVWTMTNALHDLRDMRASATLPPGVDWIGDDADYGDIVYDASSRTVTWTIASVPDDLGTVTGIVNVSVTPDDADAGKFVKLLSGTAFRATDEVTGSTVQRTTDPLTTECEGDTFAEGKGVVEE